MDARFYLDPGCYAVGIKIKEDEFLSEFVFSILMPWIILEITLQTSLPDYDYRLHRQWIKRAWTAPPESIPAVHDDDDDIPF